MALEHANSGMFGIDFRKADSVQIMQLFLRTVCLDILENCTCQLTFSLENFLYKLNISFQHYMGHAMRKRVFRHMRTTKSAHPRSLIRAFIVR